MLKSHLEKSLAKHDLLKTYLEKLLRYTVNHHSHFTKSFLNHIGFDKVTFESFCVWQAVAGTLTFVRNIRRPMSLSSDGMWDREINRILGN